MPRPCHRVRLETGLKLDLNRLARRGLIRPGMYSGPVSIGWTNSYTEEQIASAFITADMSGLLEGWFQIEIGGGLQHIILVSDRRHFGGRQWYFVCPYLHRRASVLWRPPGAYHFACRQRWGTAVAYASQFEGPDDRAHRGQAKIKSRLIDQLDPDEWDFPPKPKWMRWDTYSRAENKFDRYEAILDEGLTELAVRHRLG
jgi:hypothetical protein